MLCLQYGYYASLATAGIQGRIGAKGKCLADSHAEPAEHMKVASRAFEGESSACKHTERQNKSKYLHI